MSEENLCIVCVEKFNKSTHKPIVCGFCEYKACTSCCKAYLLTVNVPQCMNCHREWLRKFLQDNFTNVFIDKTLKEHHKKYLFDIETSLLPNAVIELKKRRDITVLKTEIAELKDKMKELQLQIYSKQGDIDIIRNGGERNKQPEENNKISFIRRCPAENCKGYLSTRWKCELCSINVCKDCHKIKSDDEAGNEHVCNNDDVETARMISNNTKSCPSCTVPIFKIDGCDQMWCVNCHVAFSWQTGRIENRVHNPHYYEWLRRSNNGNIQRERLDVQCGRDLDYMFVRNFKNLLIRLKNPVLENRILSIIRNITHIFHVDIPRYTTGNLETYNLDLRVRFLNNEITEKRFKTMLSNNEVTREKRREINNILTMYYNTSIDIIYRLHDNIFNHFNTNNKTKPALDLNIFNEITELISYVNENLKQVCDLYKIKNTLYISQESVLHATPTK